MRSPAAQPIIKEAQRAEGDITEVASVAESSSASAEQVRRFNVPA